MIYGLGTKEPVKNSFPEKVAATTKKKNIVVSKNFIYVQTVFI